MSDEHGKIAGGDSFLDTVASDPPPPYPTTPSLYLLLNDQPLQPQILLMRGDFRSPDFIVTSTSRQPIYRIKTDSTLVYHESAIYSTCRNQKLFDMKRKCTDERWMYTAQSSWSSSSSVKLFEVETVPRSFSRSDSARTRLVFRSGLTGELDAIDLQVKSSPVASSSQRFEATILHRDVEIGSIKNIGSSRLPEYQLRLGMQGIDPLLFIILALAVDDRSMTAMRRQNRLSGSGWTGLGKAPKGGLGGVCGRGGISF